MHGEQGQTVFLRERRLRHACDRLVQLLDEEEAGPCLIHSWFLESLGLLHKDI